jgi:hypothetical protein
VTVDGPPSKRRPNLPLRPPHFRTPKLDSADCDPVLGRQHLFANTDIRVSYIAGGSALAAVHGLEHVAGQG